MRLAQHELEKDTISHTQRNCNAETKNHTKLRVKLYAIAMTSPELEVGNVPAVVVVVHHDVLLLLL